MGFSSFTLLPVCFDGLKLVHWVIKQNSCIWVAEDLLRSIFLHAAFMHLGAFLCF